MICCTDDYRYTTQNNNELLPTKVLLSCIFYLAVSDFHESDNEVIPFLFHLTQQTFKHVHQMSKMKDSSYFRYCVLHFITVNSYVSDTSNEEEAFTSTEELTSLPIHYLRLKAHTFYLFLLQCKKLFS